MDDPQPPRSRARRRLAVALAALLALALVAAAVVVWRGRAEWLDLPMGEGHRWVYESADGDVVFEVVGSEIVDGRRCYSVRRTLGKESQTFVTSVSDDGLRIHRVGKDAFDPAFLEFANPVPSRAWTWRGTHGQLAFSIECRPRGIETVVVPAGNYRAYVVEEAMTFDHPMAEYPRSTTTYWIVSGVGVVKLEGKQFDLHNPVGRRFSWKLRSFSRPE